MQSVITTSIDLVLQLGQMNRCGFRQIHIFGISADVIDLFHRISVQPVQRGIGNFSFRDFTSKIAVINLQLPVAFQTEVEILVKPAIKFQKIIVEIA